MLSYYNLGAVSNDTQKYLLTVWLQTIAHR